MVVGGAFSSSSRFVAHKSKDFPTLFGANEPAITATNFKINIIADVILPAEICNFSAK